MRFIAKLLLAVVIFPGALSSLKFRAARAGNDPSQTAEPMAGGREFWAFRRLLPVTIPSVGSADRVRSPVDAFVIERLESAGLCLAPEADSERLLRRAFLDLTGLPPDAEDIRFWRADVRPDAFETLIDRLLASPRFGEFWGRHWLDVAGYSDTVGFDGNPNDLTLTEGKWRYRDWVIRSINSDLPFDQFIRLQIAGDEIADWRSAASYSPEILDSLVATGFLRTARDQTHEPESNIPLNFHAVLDDTVELVGRGLLGLTIGCARCHDHKFDPLPQQDYYRLTALFTPAYNPEDWRPVLPWKPEIRDRGLPDVPAATVEEIRAHNEIVDRRIGELSAALNELRNSVRSRLFEQQLATLPESVRGDARKAMETDSKNRTATQIDLVEKFGAALAVSEDAVTLALSGADADRNTDLTRQLKQARESRRSWNRIQALYDVGPPPVTRFLDRGEYQNPGEEVAPGFLRVLCDADAEALVPESANDGVTSGRRRALAHWLTTPGTRAAGLLARVQVNRVWQQLFGTGLVRTSDNFGKQGEPPSHPELLEWLSLEFQMRDWSLKEVLRLIMTSSVYRQASTRDDWEAAGRVDPENRLLWRMPLRRLSAEAVRDSLLAIGGQLDLRMGGPPVLLLTLPDGRVDVDAGKLAAESDSRRRSVYLLVRRSFNHSMLAMFDQPGIAVTCSRRDSSTVPLQALTMLNDQFVVAAAERLAGRVMEVSADELQRINSAFLIVLSREPTEAELVVSRRQLARLREALTATSADQDQIAASVFREFCHMLINTSEFLYVE